ncbi:pseudouridine-5'-phosphate glycosidase [Rhodovulum sp. DZ06]|uniref:pseudouridine-5'-phosphate glycosidase n=1 Tax=Rhodovulum sp. DZ06 TaxID=3425126 RepID=UPI003D332175
MTAHPDLLLSPEIAEALAAGAPVVALETAIVTHGMPHPHNLSTARAVEAEIRAAGAIPATIAVIDGVMRVGLTDAELERLAALPEGVRKASARDLPAAIAAKVCAGTTVAGTMRIAAMAGIEIFATGGIGGVHRGAESTFDISADLTELGRTRTAVVCAGAKSILDLPKTLEVLETMGVPILGAGTDAFPAFFSRTSGLSVDARLDGAGALAAAIDANARIGGAGMVICNPIPEADEIPADRIAAIIDQAVEEAEARRIGGKGATPFLLGRVLELTGGDSLKANVALVRNNARVAGEIAVALSSRRRDAA